VLISHRRQFIFVHVPKTAGQSMAAAFRPYADHPEQYLANRLLGSLAFRLNRCFPYQYRKFRKHASARQLRQQLPADVYDRYFKFAFVRNPWDRWVSLYHFMRENHFHHRHKQALRLTFEEFLTTLARDQKRAQTPYLIDAEGKLIVDYVGRFETLQEDFARISSMLKLDASLGHLHKSKRRDYRWYYDSRTMELVAEISRQDIEFLGYDFDGAVKTAAA
jgi:hypothetical protein